MKKYESIKVRYSSYVKFKRLAAKKVISLVDLFDELLNKNEQNKKS